MNWDDLRILLAVGRAKRLDRVAQRLGIDASTVSRRMARLEQAAGGRLIEQSGGERRLTALGLRLFEQAEKMERHAATIEGVPSQDPGRTSGTLRVSLSEAFATWILPHHLPAFQHAYPDIELEIVSSGGFLNPSKREADIALLLGRPQRGASTVRKAADYLLGLYGSRDYLAAHDPILTLDDLHAHPRIGFVSDLISVPQQRLWEEIFPASMPTLRASSINTQIALVRAGAGIAVLPHFAALQNPDLQPVLADQVRLRRAFWLVVHKDIRQMQAVRVFLDWFGGVLSRETQRLAPPEA